MLDEKAYWLGWQVLLPGSAKRIWSLVETFGSATAAWNSPPAELVRIGGFSREAAEILVKRRSGLVPEIELEKVESSGIRYVLYDEEDFPGNLRNIFDPPPGLFIRGSVRKEDELAVAVVGSRKPTAYGLAVAEKLGYDLAKAGVLVISGMARGIDTSAHLGALNSSGRTIAVLGCGVDVVYPRENRRMMEQIALSGAVVSEFPPGAAPKPWHFPIRNRLISGLSRGVVVVEAAKRSGALITALIAIDQGREVMAVPGNVTCPLSRGTNLLLKQGARLVENIEDVLEELGLTGLFKMKTEKEMALSVLSAEEEEVYKVMSHEPVEVDDVVKRTGLSVQKALGVLMFLEVKGLVRQLPGKKYTARL